MPLHHGAVYVETSPAPVKYVAAKLGLCKMTADDPPAAWCR